ncbi:MAG: NAD(P)-dependent oxidoreductase [Betaproteobacteria bacterium]|nr:NAD(P)-dependent oxidoreductase [Betaproteobacteria bacterium]
MLFFASWGLDGSGILILVTGGTGFVGRHLAGQFVADNRRVRVLSRTPSRHQNHGRQFTMIVDHDRDDPLPRMVAEYRGQPERVRCSPKLPWAYG